MVNEKKVGEAIAFLRKRAGFTQKDLAERIGVSDKAVSKWERGIGLPDVSYLTRLSILLDTDTDSLLSGDVIHHDKGWNGLIVLNDKSQIGLDTVIFDKPLIKYLLSYFLLVGIKRIKIICTEKDKCFLLQNFDSGSDYGIELSYSNDVQSVISDTEFLDCSNLMILFGRSLIYGVDQTRFFHKAMVNKSRITLLALPRGNRKTALSFNAEKKIVPQDFDDQLKTQYAYADIPLLFCPTDEFLKEFKQKEISQIKDLLVNHDIYIEVLDRGFVEMAINDWDEVNEASTFVRIVQEKCGMNIYCLEEVAWRRGLIDLKKLRYLGHKLNNIESSKYIQNICKAEER